MGNFFDTTFKKFPILVYHKKFSNFDLGGSDTNFDLILISLVLFFCFYWTNSKIMMDESALTVELIEPDVTPEEEEIEQEITGDL
jgi:hypothetical protein